MNQFRLASIFILALGCILLMHGAVPFFALPTLGQALTMMGYSQSFANADGWTLYASYFGYPTKIPLAMGLPLALPAGFFIRLGLHASDAYSLVAAAWLAMAFVGAYCYARFFGLRSYLAILAASLWMTMPMVWMHAGYSSLSLGIGLLPFYFWLAHRVIVPPASTASPGHYDAALYLAAPTLALFMDGYSFMMFAVGSSLLAVYAFACFRERRRQLLRFAFPVHVIAFVLAYLLYAAYIGKAQFDPIPLVYFRGWGADLAFFAAPSRGIHWLWDALGLSVGRSDQLFFGDGSVSVTTFSLPLMAVGLVAWWRTRNRNALASAFLLLALFGFYMALGPSLKINSTRSPEMIAAGQMDQTMTAEQAIAPTGNAWLSENLPGFRNMRAAYRWAALGVFGLWVLILLMLAREEGRVAKVLALLIAVFLVVSNLPHLDRKWKNDMANRDLFFRVDRELVADMRKVISPGELVAFLPYRNDFLVTYLAPQLGIRTYNMGGDKSLIEAQKSWPVTMRQFQIEQVDPDFADRILRVLARGEADVVVLPHIDMFWAALSWPPEKPFKSEVAETVRQLKKSPHISIDERQLYTVVRIAPTVAKENKLILERKMIFSRINYPVRHSAWASGAAWLLYDGWYGVEGSSVWSDSRAVLDLPVPESCTGEECFAVLKFGVFGASEQRSVEVKFASGDEASGWSARVLATRPDGHEIRIPLPKSITKRRVVIDVANAISPVVLNGQGDGRVLGISLYDIDMVDYPDWLAAEAARPGRILNHGWYPVESSQIWSGREAALDLPLPQDCSAGKCEAVLGFGVFGASPQRPVTVNFTIKDGATDWRMKVVATKPDGHEAHIPLSGDGATRRVLIDVPQAASPLALTGGPDGRILGISLRHMETIRYPIRLVAGSAYPRWVLNNGWHSPEPTLVWSQQRAVLDVPVPESCAEAKCVAVVGFSVFGASETRPVNVKFSSGDKALPWSEKIRATRPDGHVIRIPLSNKMTRRRVVIDVPDATSPFALTGAPDARILGVSLSTVTLARHDEPGKGNLPMKSTKITK